MRRQLQQEVFRVPEAAIITGLTKDTIWGAIQKNKLFAFKQRRRGNKGPCYFIPRYALYAWLGHRGSEEVARHFNESDRKRLLSHADIRREIRRVAQFEARGPWVWDNSSNPLRHWRRHVRLSADKLCSQLGLTARAIYGFERGGYYPAARSLAKYSEVMGITEERLRSMLDQWYGAQKLGRFRTAEEQDMISGPRFLARLAGRTNEAETT